MASLNKVFLIGNLTRDPELRFTPSGAAVATIGLAVNHKYQVEGEWKDEPSFFTVIAWGTLAERCSEHITKGSPVLVEGRLRWRQWETPDGQKRSTIEIVAQRIQFLPRGEKKNNHGIPDDELAALEDQMGDIDDVPF